MKLEHLINPRRYLRCRRMFRRPLEAHLRIAAAARRPLTLKLVDGRTLRVDSARRARPVFDWLLDEAADPLPVTEEDGLVIFRHEGTPIALRPIETDFFTFT